MRDSDLFSLLERTGDAAFTVDQEGIIRSWNGAAERLLGYAAASVVGQPCAQLLHGVDALGTTVCSADCDVRACGFEGSGAAAFDLAVRTSVGRRLWINVSTLVANDGRSGRSMIVHLARDASSSKEREAVLRAAGTLAQQLVRVSESAPDLPPVAMLTPQETRILRLLAEAKAPPEIARQLRISPRTLRTHLHHINRKLRTRGRLEAVIHAIRRGIIAAPVAAASRKRKSS